MFDRFLDGFAWGAGLTTGIAGVLSILSLLGALS